MKSPEVQLNEALAKIVILETENTQLKEAVSTAKIATAKAERDGQLKESKLPEPCVKRLSEVFAKSTDNAGLKEAINVEAEYVKSLGGAIKKHNGAADNTAVVNESAELLEGYREEQYKAAIATGMSEVEAVGFSGFTPKK